jgi:hypothetical protein
MFYNIQKLNTIAPDLITQCSDNEWANEQRLKVINEDARKEMLRKLVEQ